MKDDGQSSLPTQYLPPLRPIPPTGQIEDGLRLLERALGLGEEEVVDYPIEEESQTTEDDAEDQEDEIDDLASSEDIETRFVHSWLTRIISSFEIDPDTQERAARILASLCGKPASAKAITRFTFGPVDVLIQDRAVTADALGNRTWGAAPLLSQRLVKAYYETSVRSKSVLELGAGTGLVGFALLAAAINMGQILQLDTTDYHPHVLATLQANLELNAFPSFDPEASTSARVSRLDWQVVHDQVQGSDSSHYTSTAQSLPQEASDPEATTWPDLAALQDNSTSYDVLIAADCIYDPLHATWIRSVASKYLTRDHPWNGTNATSTGKGVEPGVLCLISPLRSTHTVEIEAIYQAFPRWSREVSKDEQTELTLCIVWEGEQIGYDDFGPRTLSLGKGSGQQRKRGLRTTYRTFEIRWCR